MRKLIGLMVVGLVLGAGEVRAEDHTYTATELRTECSSDRAIDQISCYSYLFGVFSTLGDLTPGFSCSPATAETLRLAFLHATEVRPLMLTKRPTVAATWAFLTEGLCTYTELVVKG